MIWHKVSTAPRHAIRSDCGRFQISRSGRPGIDERFSLWRRNPDTGAATLIYCYPTAAQAKARADEEAASGEERGARANAH